MNAQDIVEFQGENRWLSNFWPACVSLDGVFYPTVENAYQAAKTFPNNREQFQNCSAGQAKRIGRGVEIRPDWESVKVAVMRALITQKFEPRSELGKRLLATGSVNIIEGNYWGDVFWGVCKGEGKNTLGRLIMERRKELANM